MAKKTKSGSEKEAAAKKAASKKAAAKKSTKKSTKKPAKKTAKKTAKKSTSAKAGTTKASARKATAKKTAKSKAKKAGAKKSRAKKSTTREAASGKTTAKASTTKTAASKKVATKAGSKGKKKTATKTANAETPAERALRAPGRRGQVAAAKARFETGEHAPVLREQLGELPPGYDLSIVRAWIRDPRNIAIVWDINDPEMVALAERVGWDAIGVRVIDESGAIVSDLRVKKRSGLYQLALPSSGLSLRMALGLHREDGFFETLALSGPVRTPPEGPSADAGEYHTIRLEDDLDRRLLAEHEPPPRPGHHAPSVLSPGARVRARLELAYRSAVGSVDDPTLAPRIENALRSGEASAEERADRPARAGAPGSSAEDGDGVLPPGRRADSAERGASKRGQGPGAGVSSAEWDETPSSHSRPTSPGAKRR